MKVVQRCSYRSSHPEVFSKKGVLKSFPEFTRKHLCQSLFFSKVAGLRPATLFKKRLWHSHFPVNFEKFLRTTPPMIAFVLKKCSTNLYKMSFRYLADLVFSIFPEDFTNSSQLFASMPFKYLFWRILKKNSAPPFRFISGLATFLVASLFAANFSKNIHSTICFGKDKTRIYRSSRLEVFC